MMKKIKAIVKHFKMEESKNALDEQTNLASELYVSRTTIRNALKFLEQEGKIERQPGRWAIVRQLPMG